MPPTADRPHEVELLLCGHHLRQSQGTLAAAGAEIYVMQVEPGAELALLLASPYRRAGYERVARPGVGWLGEGCQEWPGAGFSSPGVPTADQAP
jgi:hypothetical protein